MMERPFARVNFTAPWELATHIGLAGVAVGAALYAMIVWWWRGSGNRGTMYRAFAETYYGSESTRAWLFAVGAVHMLFVVLLLGNFYGADGVRERQLDTAAARTRVRLRGIIISLRTLQRFSLWLLLSSDILVVSAIFYTMVHADAWFAWCVVQTYGAIVLPLVLLFGVAALVRWLQWGTELAKSPTD